MSDLVKFIQTTEANLNSIPVQDGQMIVLTDKNRIHYDVDGVRLSSCEPPSVATTSSAGLMSASDKLKLNNITDSADAVSFTRTLTSGSEIGTLTINGTAVKLYAPSNTDTKNTAGATDTSSQIFLIGATSQAANAQTYSHDTAYVGQNGHLYSNKKQVVNLTDTQALTNKTYNGYTLGDACAKGVDTEPTENSGNLITSGAAYELKKSVVDGKQLLADTINEFIEDGELDEPVAGDDTFETLNDTMLIALQNEYTRGRFETKKGTATAAQVLTGYTFTNSSTVEASGSMADRGAVVQSLSCGQACDIPEGYHNGSGKITANSLASQTSATATAPMILKGKTAWVNGSKITGTMTDYSSSIRTVNSGANSGTTTVDIADGFHTKITVNNAPAYNAGYAAAGVDLDDAYSQGYADGQEEGHYDGYVHGKEVFRPYVMYMEHLVDCRYTGSAGDEMTAIWETVRQYDHWIITARMSTQDNDHIAATMESWNYSTSTSASTSAYCKDSDSTCSGGYIAFGWTNSGQGRMDYTSPGYQEAVICMTVVAWNMTSVTEESFVPSYEDSEG